MLYLVWNRPEMTTDGALIAPEVPLSYEVHKAASAVPVDTELVAEVSEIKVRLSQLGEYVGMYFFIRAKTANGTLSAFSVGKLLGVPQAPGGLRVEDL